MKKFIRLTAHDNGNPLWISPKSIKVIGTGGFKEVPRTEIWVAGTGGGYLYVTETPEEIMQLVEMEV